MRSFSVAVDTCIHTAWRTPTHTTSDCSLSDQISVCLACVHTRATRSCPLLIGSLRTLLLPGVNRLWETSVNIKVHFITIALCFPNSSLHPLQVKPRFERKRSWGIWASTSRRPARAQSSATSWGERLCLWGRFSPTRLLTAPLWRGYKDFQTNSMMRNRFFCLYLINHSTKSKHGASIYGLKSLAYGALSERLCRVCLTVTRTWLRLLCKPQCCAWPMGGDMSARFILHHIQGENTHSVQWEGFGLQMKGFSRCLKSFHVNTLSVF